MTTAIKSISVSLECANLANEHNLSWSEAARVGMALKLAELGVSDYDNSLNLVRKIALLQDQLTKTSEELMQLKEKHDA